MGDFDQAFDQMVRTMAKKAIEDIIGRRYGSGVSKVAEVVKEEIIALLRNDPEINQLLRNGNIEWIKAR